MLVVRKCATQTLTSLARHAVGPLWCVGPVSQADYSVASCTTWLRSLSLYPKVDLWNGAVGIVSLLLLLLFRLGVCTQERRAKGLYFLVTNILQLTRLWPTPLLMDQQIPRHSLLLFWWFSKSGTHTVYNTSARGWSGCGYGWWGGVSTCILIN